MDNIYLIYGTDEYLINHNINKLIKKYPTYNRIDYDLDNDLLDSVIEELDTIGLFGNKIVICKNAKFLSRQKSNIEQSIDAFNNYLDNINRDAILILSNETIDNTKKIVKKLKNVATLIQCESYSDNELYQIIIKKFNREGYNITPDASRKIISLTHSDMNLIQKEIEKLLMYKLEEKTITLDDVNNIVSEKLDDNIFELIDAVINNQKIKIFEIYKKLIKELNYEPTKILIMIANQFRLILKTKIMTLNKLSEKEIASILKIHPYRVKLANAKARTLDIATLEEYLLQLSEIDYKIKSGLSNKYASLELFFINL